MFPFVLFDRAFLPSGGVTEVFFFVSFRNFVWIVGPVDSLWAGVSIYKSPTGPFLSVRVVLCWLSGEFFLYPVGFCVVFMNCGVQGVVFWLSDLECDCQYFVGGIMEVSWGW